MRKNQKGFTMIAALSLAVILGIGAMFLGKILSYLKLTKARTQARVSSLGYEDAIAQVIARAVFRQINLVADCGGDSAALNNQARDIPGTGAQMNIDSMNPAAIANATGTLILNTTLNPQGGMVGTSDRFIDNPARITFRIEFLSKDLPQNQKTFGPSLSCQAFKGLGPADRQMKVVYTIVWNYKGKDLTNSGTKLINLSEIGL